jgi:hypothetical protein
VISPLTIEVFKDILETYGANPARWPEESIEACQNFIENDSEAERLFRSYAKVDAAFDGDVGEPPSDLLKRILAKAK